MTALSTDALLVILVASTVAMLATWLLLSRRRGRAAHHLLVITCAFFAGVSMGTTFALAARTPWLWSIAGLRAGRTEAMASSRVMAVPLQAEPSEAHVAPAVEPVSVPSREPVASHAAAPSSRASSPPSSAPVQTPTSVPVQTNPVQTKKMNVERAGPVDQAPPGRDLRLKPAVPPDRAVTIWERRGGTVVSVDGPMLTIEEMGQWTGTSTRPTRTSITMTPETRIELLERGRDASAHDPLGSFKASSLARTDLRAGDYVTVTLQSTGERHVATSIAVVRPSAARLEPSAADAPTSGPGAQSPAPSPADTASPPRAGAPISAPPPASAEIPARPRAEGRSEDGSAAIDWFLKR
jgi:hypothetical protein